MKKPLQADVIKALQTVYDPEIPLDIITLGLVYNVQITSDNDVDITITLTFPGCPLIDEIEAMIVETVSEIQEVEDVYIHITFDPPWNPNMITSLGREEMGMGEESKPYIKNTEIEDK
jgi:metal-sulfur cluster biosynthetic enzyme